MNTFFATVGASLSRNSTCAPVGAEIDTAPIQTISDVSISENSISRKIKALKVNKAEGPDGITPKLLRLAEPAVVPSLTKLYSLSAKEGEVFSLWKKAHLCPVFKKDDPTDRNNYRHILVKFLTVSLIEHYCIN